ncbi:MAG TPA: TIGR04086 family membrane protein [Peptococcaceae bacterium]|nr:MAG: Uncharacterized protein XD50_0243 [Clostridia bacterium 41_269]HBT19985.1 TIGR04086 family membrane protein [Peptococcaceae bacterium]
MNSNFRKVLLGLPAAIVTAFTLSIIISLIFHFTSISELYLPITALAVVVISTFIGGLIGASTVGSRGLLSGMIVGLSFFVLITAFSFLHPEQLTLVNTIKKIAVCIISGGLGGIIGVSLK